MRTELTISSASQGQASQWSYDLAQAINAAHSDVRVGVKDESGVVNPAHGVNNVYVKDGSTLKSVAISYEEQQTQASEDIAVTNVQFSKIKNGAATVTFHVNTRG